jgi:hypothetical protein
MNSHTIIIKFHDGSKRTHPCESVGQAKRVFLQALGNPITQRTGATVTCVDALGNDVDLFDRPGSQL